MNKKRILSIAVAAVLTVGAVAGISTAVRATTAKKIVKVYAASDISTGGAWNLMSDLYGTITQDASQNYYLEDGITVREVMVGEGDQVRKGDVLLTIDTEKTAISLQQDEINRDRIQLNIDVANKNIATLKKMKPASDSDVIPVEPVIPDDSYFPDEPDIPDEPDTPDEPDITDEPDTPGADAVCRSALTGTSAPFNAGEKKAGTRENPYRYLTEENVLLTPSFIQEILRQREDAVVRLEYYEDDKVSGTPKGTWTAEAADLKDLTETLTVNVEKGALIYNRMNGRSVASNLYQEETASGGKDDSGGEAAAPGSKKNPAVFALKADGEIDQDFLPMLRESGWQYVRIDLYDPICHTASAGGTEVLCVSDIRSLCVQNEKVEVSRDGAVQPEVTPGPTESPAPTDNPEPTGTSDPTAEPTPSSCPAETAGQDTGDSAVLAAAAPDGMCAAVPADCRRVAGLNENSAAFPADHFGKDGTSAVLTADVTGEDNSEDADDSSGHVSSDIAGSIIDPSTSMTKEQIQASLEDNRTQIRDLKLDLREAELKIKKEKKSISDGTVRAELNGVVKKVGDPEETTSDGSPFLQVTGSNGVYVRFDVPENMLDQVRKGDYVMLTSWMSGITCEAEIQVISDYPDSSDSYMYDDGSNQSQYPVTAYVAQGGDGLQIDEAVQVELEGSGTADSSGIAAAEGTEEISADSGIAGEEELLPGSVSADSAAGDGAVTAEEDLYILKAFVRDEDGRKYVYRRGGDGRLVRQEVETGEISGEGIEIKSGVSFDDYLAFPYGKNVKEGAKTQEATIDELYSGE